MDDRDLIAAAIHALQNLWSDRDVDMATPPTGRQGDVQWRLAVGDERYQFNVEVKRQVNLAAAASLAERAATEPRQEFLLITEFAQPAVAQALQQRGINYADAVGNCHIEQPPLLIHAEGRKRRPRGDVQPVRAFGGEGLKVIFALILEPTLASRPYRDLAKLAGVSHGVVQYTVKDLERLGLLVTLHRTARRLRDTDTLLNRWSASFGEVLRPKLTLGTFRFSTAGRESQWKDADLDPATERWGGEPAAAIATGYLRPARLTLYTRGTRGEVMQRLRMVPDERGTVEVLRAFWPVDLERQVPVAFPDACVPDVLAFSDLIASGDPRNAEVASMLQERMNQGIDRG